MKKFSQRITRIYPSISEKDFQSIKNYVKSLSPDEMKKALIGLISYESEKIILKGRYNHEEAIDFVINLLNLNKKL